MRIVAHGVDIVVCSRIERIWKEHGPRFLDRIYTPRERDYCLAARDATPRLAGRFATKEAVMKALGVGWRAGIEWTDIETLPDGYGKPHVALAGQTALRAREIGIDDMLISISHAGDYAVASAIGVAGA
jgi:holo-[acyl-carrier protein] synthase